MIRKKFDFLEVRLCGKLCVNFYSVAMKNTLCTIRLLAKFDLPTTVCQKPSNFSFILSNLVLDIVRVQINAIEFIFFDADVRTFEIRITA